MRNKETTETLFYPTTPQLEEKIWQKLFDINHTKFIHLNKNNKDVKIEKLLPVTIGDKKNYLVSYTVNDTAVTQWIDKTRNRLFCGSNSTSKVEALFYNVGFKRIINR